MMPVLKITITRYISDDPQPGLVEGEFTDTRGRRWSLVEKTAIVSDRVLSAQSPYPQPGFVAVDVLSRHQDPTGRTRLVINTSPWGVESVEGAYQFEVWATCVESDPE